MKRLWSGSSDEFFQEFFTYLKRRFNVKLSAFPFIQKTTGIAIYHETIVALECVHEVLRKIENSSAPTREDYEFALREKNEERAQAILDFYKKLALVDGDQSDAFQDFRHYYYFDNVISNYSIFLDQYNKNVSPHSDQFFKLSSLWNEKKFDSDNLFKFIEHYQAQLSLGLGGNNYIQKDIAIQDRLYETLMRDYDELVSRVKSVGVSVIDIILPSNLRMYEGYSELFSPSALTNLVRHLEAAFRNDEGIFLTVNHAHVISNKKFVLSYIVIYKVNVYKTSEAMYEWIWHEVQSIIGKMYMYQVNVISREDMLQSIFPQEVFTGRLESKKKKQAFRTKFLRYFLSSIFLLKFDKTEELADYEEMKCINFNKHIFCKEKISYRDEERITPSYAPQENLKLVQQKPVPLYLDELSNEIELEKFDRYFNNRGLPTEEIKKSQQIQFLCKQQDITNISGDVIDDLVRIELFLSRLGCEAVYEFADGYNKNSFEASPKLIKLSLLFQQFLLVSEMDFIHDRTHLPRELNLKAISFIEQYESFFAGRYEVYKTGRLRRHLGKYKIDLLQPTLKQERQELNKASKKIASIQQYLSQVLETDVVVLRFIFKCRVRGYEQAKMFDAMFRDYIDNLKRRYTQGFRLEGHIGLYIPHQRKHYIDATLFFKTEKHVSMDDIDVLIKALIDYWTNYVDNKQEQIHKFNEKHPQNNKMLPYLKTTWLLNCSESDLKSKRWEALDMCKRFLNPFSDLKYNNLTARSLSVVKTENSLNHSYVEISKGQRVKRKLLIEKISLYYAYSPMILVAPDDYELLPRKNCLILGRVRSAHPKKDNQPVTSSPDNIEGLVEKEIAPGLMSDDSSG